MNHLEHHHLHHHCCDLDCESYPVMISIFHEVVVYHVYYSLIPVLLSMMKKAIALRIFWEVVAK